MVDTVSVHELRERLGANPDLTVVDALSAEHFNHSRLPGALNLQPAQVSELAPQRLPERDAEIVVYGTDSTCRRSTEVAGRLAALGYTNVRVYRGGKVEWMEAGLPIEGYFEPYAEPHAPGEGSPIACTGRPSEMIGREEEVRTLGRDGLLSAERGERRVVLRFRPDAIIKERLADFVATESRCCAFLTFRFEDEPGARVLTIVAPEGGEAVLRDLANMLAADGSAAA